MSSVLRCRPAGVLVLVVALLSSCSGGEEAASPTTTTSTTPELELTVTRAEHVAGGFAVVDLPAPVRDEVVDVVTAFLSATSLEALATGEPGDGIEQLVTEGAAARVLEADRAALVDAGGPEVDDLVVETAEVELSGLGGGPDVDLVVAGFDVSLQGRTGADAELTVRRSGELTLVPVDDEWRISAYEVDVQRSGLPTTTTSVQAAS